MNIAVIEPVCAHGGMDYYDYSLCKGLIKAGQRVKLYTSDAGTSIPQGIEVIETFRGVYKNDKKLLQAIKWLLALYKSISDARRFGANIVHFHFFGNNPLYHLNVRFARLWGFKVVATIHDVESFASDNNKDAMHGLLSLLDGIVVHNETSKKEVFEILGKKSKRVSVIPHGNYLDYIGQKTTKHEARARLNLSEDCKLILFFGQIKKVKGLEIAIKALALLKKTVPNVKLLIAGKMWKDSIAYYDMFIKELNLNDSVIFHLGYIPQDKVDNYYYAADVIVLPYRKIYQSGVLLMAMSYGIPIIASDLPGMKEVVKDEENGLLFPVDDHESLARAIARIINNELFAEQLGQKGQEYVKVHHDWNMLGLETAKFYSRVIESYESIKQPSANF